MHPVIPVAMPTEHLKIIRHRYRES